MRTGTVSREPPEQGWLSGTVESERETEGMEEGSLTGTGPTQARDVGLRLLDGGLLALPVPDGRGGDEVKALLVGFEGDKAMLAAIMAAARTLLKA